MDQQHDNRSSWKNRVICVCDCVVWNTRETNRIASLFQMLLFVYILCDGFGFCFFFRNFFDVETFNVTNCATLALMLIAFRRLFVSDKRAMSICFGMWSHSRRTNQLNLLGAQNYRQTVSPTYRWHANPLIAMTMSLCQICRKKTTHTHKNNKRDM